MSIQNSVNALLGAGALISNAAAKEAKENTALAKEKFNLERGRAEEQAKNLTKLSKGLTEDETAQLADEISDKVQGGLTRDREIEMSKKNVGILGEKKKQKEYLRGASIEEYNQAIYQSANHRVQEILALKKEQMEYSKATNGLYDNVSAEVQAEIRKQLGGKE